MLALIVQAMGFGFSAGVSPGPFQTFLISTTLRDGWRRGLPVCFAPLLTDAPIILLTVALLDGLPPATLDAIRVVGGLFALYLAWVTWRGANQAALSLTADAVPAASARTTLLQAAGANFTSPGPYLFWGTLTGPILVAALDDSIWHAAAFLLAFYGTFIVILVGLVIAFDRLRRLDPRLTRGALRLAALILALFGAALIAQGLARV